MNFIIAWLKKALHLRPTQLKNAPGISDPKAAAAHINGVVGPAIDAAAPSGFAAVENALKVRPDQLAGAPGISDHTAAADAINAIVQSKIGQ